MDKNIQYLINHYYQIQEHRIAFGNQIMQLKLANEPTEPLSDYFKRLYEIEKDMTKHLKGVLKKHIMSDWLQEVKGIGPVLGCALVSYLDIRKADHASSFWKYCGLDPNSKREAGKKLDYNPLMKTICWKIGESFVKTKGKYREVYDSSRVYYDQKFPKEVKEGKRTLYTKGHKFSMSKRRAVKLFLSHFWAEWRSREGLTVSVPFAHRVEAEVVQEPNVQ